MRVLELSDYSDKIKMKLKQQEFYINDDRQNRGCSVEFKVTY